MKLKDTGLTVQDIKDKVNKYMIETYERFDFLAETAEGMYIYDENGTPYLDFYAGIAVNNAGNRNPKVVAAVKDQVAIGRLYDVHHFGALPDVCRSNCAGESDESRYWQHECESWLWRLNT